MIYTDGIPTFGWYDEPATEPDQEYLVTLKITLRGEDVDYTCNPEGWDWNTLINKHPDTEIVTPVEVILTTRVK